MRKKLSLNERIVLEIESLNYSKLFSYFSLFFPLIYIILVLIFNISFKYLEISFWASAALNINSASLIKSTKLEALKRNRTYIWTMFRRTFYRIILFIALYFIDLFLFNLNFYEAISSEIRYSIANIPYEIYNFYYQNPDLIEQNIRFFTASFLICIYGHYEVNKKVKVLAEFIKDNKDKSEGSRLDINSSYSFKDNQTKPKNIKNKVSSNIDQIIKKANDYKLEADRFFDKLSIGEELSLEIIKNYENAISFYSDASSLDPDNIEIYYAKGLILSKLKMWEEAIDNYNKVFELKEDNDLTIEFYRNRAECNFELFQYQECINDCLIVEEKDINKDYIDQQHIYLKAQSYFMLENYVSARKNYSKLIKLDPKNTTYLLNRGKSYLENQNPEKAIKDFENCLIKDPNNKFILEDLIESYKLINDFEGSLNYLNKLILIDNTNIKALSFKAAILSNNEEYEKSNQLYSKIIKLDPKQDEAFEGRGWCFYNRGQYEEAINDFSEAVKINKNNDTAYSGRGLSLIEIGNKIEAKNDFSNALKLNPNNIFAKNFFEKD